LRIILDTLVQQDYTNPERIYFVQRHQILVDPRYVKSFLLVFCWIECFCCINVSVKFDNNWFTLHEIEPKVNVAIIIRLCSLNEIWFFVRTNTAYLRYALVYYINRFWLIVWVKMSVLIGTISMVSLQNLLPLDYIYIIICIFFCIFISL
jgi:hypothetical protein